VFDAEILVAEDNQVNQEVCRQMLEGLGCRAHMVSNGAQALQALSEASYDLVLMDCQMPELDGYEATRAIREREAETDGPARHQIIVALTAHAMEGDRERCLAAGMNDYLSKPFTLRQLQETLARWLPRRRKDPAGIGGDGERTGAPGRNAGESAKSAMADGRKEPVEESSRALESHINRKTWEEILSIETATTSGLLNRILKVYLEDSSAAMVKLREAAFRKNLQEASDLVHSLKSSSANVGAMNLSSLCAEMERIARKGDTEHLLPIFGRIEAEYQSVRRVLDSELTHKQPNGL
jgi:CheY-like chemotaxis protein/HPt (histidine-containing phosphotransfer) domain-containing protein